MKIEKLIINNTELTLIFDFVSLPSINIGQGNNKTVCYFNFKAPNEIIIGEIIRNENGIVLFDNEKEARVYAIEYIKEKYKTYL